MEKREQRSEYSSKKTSLTKVANALIYIGGGLRGVWQRFGENLNPFSALPGSENLSNGLPYRYAFRDGGKEAVDRANRRRERQRREYTELGDKLTAIISLAGIVIGLYFLSSNFTGFSIANLTQTSSNWIGVVLLVIGLICGFFWLAGK